MIKLRAWDTARKIMREYHEIKGLSLIELNKDDYWVIEQFTGMKDQDGNEIYENDILSFGSVWCVGDEYDPREEYHVGIVEYRPDCASYVVNCSGKVFPLEEMTSFDGYSVRGNLHQDLKILEDGLGTI